MTLTLVSEPVNPAIAASTRDFMQSGLPLPVKALILAVLRDLRTGPDQCLILADALAEVGQQQRVNNFEGACWHKAANALRDVASVVAS